MTNADCAKKRLPTIPPDQYTDEQKKAAADFLVARKTPVFGPFEPMIYSPDVMTLARQSGDYLRYHSALGNVLSEFVVLIVAREWSQDFEWSVHQPIALKVGVAQETADAIADGRRPENMSDDEDCLYAFVTELLTFKRVSDKTFFRVEKRFGKKGVVDLTGMVGYYTSLAMQLNVARYQAPKDAPHLQRFPDC